MTDVLPHGKRHKIGPGGGPEEGEENEKAVFTRGETRGGSSEHGTRATSTRLYPEHSPVTCLSTAAL